jgi:hypothetical protein
VRGLFRIADELDRSAHLHGRAPRSRDRVRVGLMALGRGRDEAHPEAGRADHQRDAHVVPIAEIGEAGAREPAQPLANRHQVGERLAWVRVVREPVDDGDVRVLGELLNVLLREGADHDCVEVALEHVRRVLDRLAAAELEVAGGEVEAVAAELGDPDLEGDAGARRRLLEDHAEAAAGEKLMWLSALPERLQLVGEVEGGLQLLGVPGANASEVPTL